MVLKNGSIFQLLKRCSRNAIKKIRVQIYKLVSFSYLFFRENTISFNQFKVTGASVAFQRYDADRDDDFVRYPCDIRLDGYRLIITLASKQWGDEKKGDNVKFIGYREYLVKGKINNIWFLYLN